LVPGSSDTTDCPTTTFNSTLNGTLLEEEELILQNDEANWLFCVSLGGTLLLLAVHGILSKEHNFYLINHYIRCTFRIVFGVLIILLPNINIFADFGIQFSGLLLIGIVASLILILALIEIVGTLHNYNTHGMDEGKETTQLSTKILLN